MQKIAFSDPTLLMECEHATVKGIRQETLGRGRTNRILVEGLHEIGAFIEAVLGVADEEGWIEQSGPKRGAAEAVAAPGAGPKRGGGSGGGGD